METVDRRFPTFRARRVGRHQGGAEYLAGFRGAARCTGLGRHGFTFTVGASTSMRSQRQSVAGPTSPADVFVDAAITQAMALIRVATNERARNAVLFKSP